LKLENISKIQKIKFGKFYKPHSNNMKDFKISVGMNEKFMKTIFVGGRKKNLTKELKNTEKEEFFELYTGKPARFLKILPISSYKFFSIFFNTEK
jgi:hypothetical protein